MNIFYKKQLDQQQNEIKKKEEEKVNVQTQLTNLQNQYQELQNSISSPNETHDQLQIEQLQANSKLLEKECELLKRSITQEEYTGITSIHYSSILNAIKIINPPLSDLLHSSEHYNLTSYEKIICIFSFYKVSNKEIEIALEKKSSTIKQAKMRIKKKIDIEKRYYDLESILQALVSQSPQKP